MAEAAAWLSVQAAGEVQPPRGRPGKGATQAPALGPAGGGGEASSLDIIHSRGCSCSAGSQCHLVASVPALGGLEGPGRVAEREIGRETGAAGRPLSHPLVPSFPSCLRPLEARTVPVAALPGNPGNWALAMAKALAWNQMEPEEGKMGSKGPALPLRSRPH